MTNTEVTKKQNEAIELSIVIPCFNSSKALPDLNERLNKVLFNLQVNYEIIYVNDASEDNTLKILKDIAQNEHGKVAIELQFNVGQFRALMCGLEHSRGDYVVTMDDDLQHPPEEVTKLYYELKNNDELDAAIGIFQKKEHSLIRNMGSYFVQKMRGSISAKTKDYRASSFRCLTRPLVNTVISHRTMFPSIGLLIFHSSNRIKNVEVEHHQRIHGRSNYSCFKLTKTLLDNVISYTSLPLKIISILGIILLIIGFALALYYLINYSLGRTFSPGWFTVMILLNVYSGIILTSIGVLGEYIIKVLQEVNGYPRYYVKNIYKKMNSF